MAVGAGITAGNMVIGFASYAKIAIMTAAAITTAVGVIPKTQIAKVGRAVTILTDIICRDMIGALTCSLNAIVATRAVVFDTGMVK